AHAEGREEDATLSVQHSRFRYSSALRDGTVQLASHATNLGRVPQWADKGVAVFGGGKIAARRFLEPMRSDEVRPLRSDRGGQHAVVGRSHALCERRTTCNCLIGGRRTPR